MNRYAVFLAGLLLLLSATLSGCGGRAGSERETRVDELLPLSPVKLAPGEALRAVATTNIVADVVAQVGGDRIELTRLMPVGADPHSYQATPQDLRAIANAHVIFINGLGLEEFLDELIANAGGNAVVVPLSAGIGTVETTDERPQGTDDERHDSRSVDPHVWFSVPNVMIWTENVQHTLSGLDVDNAEAYADAAIVYRETLRILDGEIREMVAAVPTSKRRLVTDHPVFNYFNREYGFEQIGSVIPSFSASTQPSAQELAALQRQMREAGVPAIFVGTTVNPNLATRLAQDLGIRVVTVYTDSLSEPDGPAATYVDFMRYNVGAIVDALK